MVIVSHLKRIETTPLFYHLRETSFGPVALIWKRCGKQPKIERILISKPDAPAGQRGEAAFPERRACLNGRVVLLIECMLAGT